MADGNKIINVVDVGESGPEFLLDHTDPNGFARPDVWRQAVADFYQLDTDASILWSQIGPAPLVVDNDQIYMGVGPDSGEVTDILIDPTGTTDQIIYICTDDGGVWKTADGGGTWSPLTDQMFTISMGAIAMDPDNSQILYAGSGNLFDGGSAFTKNAGIYRSADAGLTWSIVDGGYFGTIFNNMGINRIVCPVSECLLVATNVGLYRSADGGRNFGANAPDFDDQKPVVTGKISCLFLDTASPASIVYAGVAGDAIDANGNLLATRGLLMSTDVGVTFGTNLFSNPGAPGKNKAPYGSFVVAQSQFDGATPNSATFYASVQYTQPPTAKIANPTPTYVGLFRSTDSGKTWKVLNSLGNVAKVDKFTQTNYDLTIGVDPVNSRRVYAGFQQVWLSIDGGQTFSSPAITSHKVHWDNHAIVFSPATHRGGAAISQVYTGTDGGIATSNNGGASWNCINGNIATNLFCGIGMGKGGTDQGKGVPNAFTYGGCQDTGNSGHRPTDAAGQWHAGINGDGWLVVVDPADPTVVYGFDDGLFAKTTNSGGSWTLAEDQPQPRTIGKGLTNPDPSYARAIALEQTGTDAAARTVYVSEGKKLYKSIDSGLQFVDTNLSPPDYIKCIATTAGAAALVWVGCNDGSVHCSTDGGASWDASPMMTVPVAPGTFPGPVNGIAIDPAKPLRVAAVYGGVSGIHSKYKTRHVALTEDDGATWFDVSGTDGNGPVGNLPDLTLRSVLFDTTQSPSGIIVAGDSGVLRSIDAAISGTGTSATGTATWKIYGAGLPMVCCNSLAVDDSVTPPILRVGTYGRSCFEATHPTGAAWAADFNLAFGTVATGHSVILPFYVYNCGDANLDISAASVVGTSQFSFDSSLSLPISIVPGGTQAFQITFAPSATGDVLALLAITSNDATQGTRNIPVSGTGVNTGLLPRLASNPIATVGFGTVVGGQSRAISVQLFNVGTKDLSISAINVVSGSNDFSIVPPPAFPISIAAGGESDVTFKFTPSGQGPVAAQFAAVSPDVPSPLTLMMDGSGDLVSAAFWGSILGLLGLAHAAVP